MGSWFWQVLVPGDVLAPWIEEGGGHPSEEITQHGAAVKLFSTNDYLGLSTHVALRRAAADAALLYGVGMASSQDKKTLSCPADTSEPNMHAAECKTLPSVLQGQGPQLL